MDRYQGYPDFITNYEVDENGHKISIEYADQTKTTVIDSRHNRDVMEERLYNQHQKIKKFVLPNLENQRRMNGCAVLNFVGFVGMELSLAKFSSVMISALFATYFGCKWLSNHKRICRLRLTDYCLEHADFIRLTKDSPNSYLQLSDAGQKAFELDHGFSLNHAHLYTNHDLKVLKKVNSQENLQENFHE